MLRSFSRRASPRARLAAVGAYRGAVAVPDCRPAAGAIIRQRTFAWQRAHGLAGGSIGFGEALWHTASTISALFVGNIAAAKVNVRTLPTQRDYNRTWPGTTHLTAPETTLIKKVFEIVSDHAPYASIDIHNNTGNNPHYACVTRLDERYLHLARLFSRTVVYFEKPVGVQSAALAAICPAVTIECGRTGVAAGADHAAEFVESALAMSHLPDHPVPASDVDLLRTFAIIKVPREASVSFDGSDADFRFRADLDRLNFSEIEEGTSFGFLGGSRRYRLSVLPGEDCAITEPYFDYSGGWISITRRTIPAMLTVDPPAIRLDS